MLFRASLNEQDIGANFICKLPVVVGHAAGKAVVTITQITANTIPYTGFFHATKFIFTNFTDYFGYVKLNL